MKFSFCLRYVGSMNRQKINAPLPNLGLSISIISKTSFALEKSSKTWHIIVASVLKPLSNHRYCRKAYDLRIPVNICSDDNIKRAFYEKNNVNFLSGSMKNVNLDPVLRVFYVSSRGTFRILILRVLSVNRIISIAGDEPG